MNIKQHPYFYMEIPIDYIVEFLWAKTETNEYDKCFGRCDFFRYRRF